MEFLYFSSLLKEHDVNILKISTIGFYFPSLVGQLDPAFNGASFPKDEILWTFL